MARIHFLHLAGWLGAVAVVACSANPTDNVFEPVSGSGGSGGMINTAGSGGTIPTAGAGGGLELDSGPIEPGSDCAESAKKIYLVTEERALWSFNPEIDGMAAYAKIGQLGCQSSQNPQSMSVDRSGKAYVFYSSGQLFLVDTTNAQCTPLPSYKHPLNCALGCQLGMGFTADSPGSKGQLLYIQSPDFGLSVVDTTTFAIDKKNVFSGMAAELTGGPDAKLFRFEADTAALVELTQGSWQTTPIHTFNLKNVMAWAFGRYAGKFYMFTASSAGLGVGPSKTTIYDQDANTESTRDPNLNMTVVGAGQSTCVPPPIPK